MVAVAVCALRDEEVSSFMSIFAPMRSLVGLLLLVAA
jgi:hypothetical protein